MQSVSQFYALLYARYSDVFVIYNQLLKNVYFLFNFYRQLKRKKQKNISMYNHKNLK